VIDAAGALWLAGHDALFVGDAFATYSVTDGRHGPRIAPFTEDRAQALDSLARIADSPAAVVLPGHGQPWMLGMAEAVRQVQASEPQAVHRPSAKEPTARATNGAGKPG
jgi:glyoxylase-like metal-dependent hydrolase (beta-lactamase superfamily II)